jgi:hypothetical protein
MCFAGLVEDLDINRSTQLVSLLGRNVGIEIAQLVIIFLTFPMLFILRRTRIYMGIFTVVSIGLAAVSSVWVVERIFELDLRVSKVVDEGLAWPRALWIMLALTIVAAAYHEYEKRAGRLLPVGERHRSADDVEDQSDPESKAGAEPALQG